MEERGCSPPILELSRLVWFLAFALQSVSEWISSSLGAKCPDFNHSPGIFFQKPRVPIRPATNGAYDLTNSAGPQNRQGRVSGMRRAKKKPRAWRGSLCGTGASLTG